VFFWSVVDCAQFTHCERDLCEWPRSAPRTCTCISALIRQMAHFSRRHGTRGPAGAGVSNKAAFIITGDVQERICLRQSYGRTGVEGWKAGRIAEPFCPSAPGVHYEAASYSVHFVAAVKTSKSRSSSIERRCWASSTSNTDARFHIICVKTFTLLRQTSNLTPFLKSQTFLTTNQIELFRRFAYRILRKQTQTWSLCLQSVYSMKICSLAFATDFQSELCWTADQI